MMTRTLCLLLILVGCDKGGGTVGTETGNALTVGGSGAQASAGQDLSEATVDIERVEIRDESCGDWAALASDQQVDALGESTVLPLDMPVCGVRLQVRSAQAVVTNAQVESPSFQLTFEFGAGIAQPRVQFDVAGWLVDDALSMPNLFRRNVRKSATSHRGADDEVLDEDSSSDDDGSMDEDMDADSME